MSFKVLVFLFQLSALVANFDGQPTFPAFANSYPGNGGDGSYSFWDSTGFELNSDRDLDHDASLHIPQASDTIFGHGPELLIGANEYPGISSSQRQFYFPNQIFPGFSFNQQQQQLPPPFFNFPQFSPWWQGDNVCVSKDESADEWTGNEVGLATQPDFTINLQTCSEGKNQYICKTTTNRGGKKLTVVTTRQCCQGYGRFPHRHGPNAGCVKVEMMSFEAAAKKYGYSEFLETLKMANVTQDQVEQSTLLLPLRGEMKESENFIDKNNTSIELETESFPITTEDILEYVISKKSIDLEEIENEEVVETESGHGVRFNVYPRHSRNETDYEYRYHYTANCVRILKPKIFAPEGMILGLEKQLPVAEKSLSDLLNEREDMSKFSQMVENFNLTELLDEQDALTILAPNDEAFSNMDAIEMRMLISGDECVEEYVKNHILGLTMCSSAVVRNRKANVQNILKQTLTFERDDENDQVLINQFSRAIETDLIATNGVLHVLDKPLPSEIAMTVLSLMKNKNSTIFAELLLKSGFAEQFEDLRGVTFFVPTDMALKETQWKKALDSNSTYLVKNASLHDFLSNHIVDNVIGSHDFRTAFVKTMAKQELKMNNPKLTGTTLNCARFVSTDGVSCNRAIHQIDRALEIPNESLLEALEANIEYSKFMGILKRANLTHLVNDQVRDITVLVPTNDVFEEQKEFYEEIINSNVEVFVKRHMILSSVCCSNIPKYPLINTVQSVNGDTLVITRQRRPMIGNAHITKCDIQLKNGIIFEVNDIIE